MGRDTTHITDAARDFDGYATDLREHARHLALSEAAQWTSDSAREYRTLLRGIARHLGTLAGDAEQAARSLRAHAAAVARSDVADALHTAGELVEEAVVTVAAPLADAYRWATS